MHLKENTIVKAAAPVIATAHPAKAGFWARFT